MPLRIVFTWHLLMLGIFLMPCGASQALAGEDIIWQQFETKHSILRYQSSKDLKAFNRKVQYSPDATGLGWLFGESSSDDLNEDLKKKVDSLYERVQNILDMRKATGKSGKVKINLYHNKDQLLKAWFNIYRENRKVRAWYIFESNTIYISVQDLHAGMLAHEMAHSIIDHYLTVRPPNIAAEILAQYVDSHLLN